jgi:hypothetical protein
MPDHPSGRVLIPVLNDGQVDEDRLARDIAESEGRCRDLFAAADRGDFHVTLNTDNTFLEGHCNNNQMAAMHPTVAKRLADDAAAAGVNIKGKVYLSGLAAYPGDPHAWVSGKGDVQKVIERRNWNCDGSVKVKCDSGRMDAPQPDIANPLAEVTP